MIRRRTMPLFFVLVLCNSLILYCVMILSGGSLVQASEDNKDMLHSVYGAVKIEMPVVQMRDIVKRLGLQDLKEIPESLEQPGDSTSGTFSVRIVHKGNKNNDFTDTHLSLLFTSEGYGSPLILVSARWEKNMRNGSSLEYSKKKGR